MSKNRSKNRRRAKGTPSSTGIEPTLNSKVISMSSKRRPRPGWCSVLVLLPAFILSLCALDHLWITEDAFITFKSVENLWNGYGPNFNRGLRVESFSHPLWFIVLVLLRLAGQAALPLLAAATGIVLSVCGLILATEGARIRFQSLPRLFPLGALIVVALPPFWDFASSGLETGLTFAWIGGVAWCLARIAQSQQGVLRERIFWLLGLAPLIRPDLTVMALAPLGIALLISRSANDMRLASVLRLARFIAPGLVWQIFRMGYYGLLVPNTYLAKEGFGSRWDQGLIYLHDMYGLYWLYPVLALALTLVLTSCSASTKQLNGSSRFSACAIPLALIVSGTLHSALVCRTGGDFMHARLLLPGLFAILSACAVVSFPSALILRRACLYSCLLWAAWIALCIRPPYKSNISPQGIADERAWYIQRLLTTRPVTLDDYNFHTFYRIGAATSELARRNRDLKAIYWAHIGITTAVMPDYLTIIDPLALNDHIGSHLTLLKRGRSGHEKIARAAWFLARYPAGTGMVIRNQLAGEFQQAESPEAIQAARIVLASAPIRELNEAVSSPFSTQLFFTNITRAFRLTTLRIPPDPIEAVKKFR